MRKIAGIVILIIIMMSLNVEAATYTTVKVNTAASYKSAGTKYLPAVVRGQSGLVAALETVVLALPATRSGQIAAALAMAGMSYGATKLFDYLTEEGFSTNSTTGAVEKTLTTTVPANTYPMWDFVGQASYPNSGQTINEHYNGMYVSQAAAQAACGPAPTGGDIIAMVPTSVHCGHTFTNVAAYCSRVYDAPSHTWEYNYYFYMTGSPQTVDVNRNVPATESDIAGSIATGLINENAAAEDALNDVLNRVNDSLTNLNDTLRKNQKWGDIQGHLDGAISQDTKTSLDTKLADPNAASTYATQTTTTNTSTTTNTTTYNTTTNNYYENQGTFASLSQYNQGTQTTKSAYEQPEVGDFSQLMADFIDTMKNTDLFSLPGLMTSSIPSSGGDCELTINLGQHFGGTKTISFCEWATALSYIKAVLLCLASVVGVGIVCKGGAA